MQRKFRNICLAIPTLIFAVSAVFARCAIRAGAAEAVAAPGRELDSRSGSPKHDGSARNQGSSPRPER